MAVNVSQWRPRQLPASQRHANEIYLSLRIAQGRDLEGAFRRRRHAQIEFFVSGFDIRHDGLLLVAFNDHYATPA